MAGVLTKGFFLRVYRPSEGELHKHAKENEASTLPS